MENQATTDRPATRVRPEELRNARLQHCTTGAERRHSHLIYDDVSWNSPCSVGVCHSNRILLCCVSHPCLHYQINEAWFHATDEEEYVSTSSFSPDLTAASTAVHAKTANGGDASWSYKVDPAKVSHNYHAYQTPLTSKKSR